MLLRQHLLRRLNYETDKHKRKICIQKKIYTSNSNSALIWDNTKVSTLSLIFNRLRIQATFVLQRILALHKILLRNASA